MAEYEEEVKQKTDVFLQDIPVTSFSVVFESLISLGRRLQGSVAVMVLSAH
jgi:hypothetical protein